MPAPYNHSSGLPGVYDRAPDFPDWARVLFREGRIAQASEVMEMQTIGERRDRRIADRIMRDGDRIEGAEIIVNADAEEVTLTAGQVYARGDVRAVPAATLEGVAMTGEVVIGVRVIRTVITEEQEAALLGLHPGSEAEGEAGAAREAEVAVWGYAGDGEPGDLFQVYLLKDGVAVDQTPPPTISGVTQAIALYDADAHGSYVVRGCQVSALGLIAGDQHFSIGEGTANINGFKRARQFALRHVEEESPDLSTVDAEPHTFADGGSGTAVIQLNRGPLSELLTAIITKQRTVTLTKGLSNSLDLLPDSGVASIISVTQGPTTYTQGTDYVLTGDRVDWSPGGTEPASGSSYNVTYRYLDAVTPDATTTDTVTLSGGVTGTAVLLSYRWKLPRYDLLCLNQDGLPVYIKGVSGTSPRAPEQPVTLLALAEIRNDWRGAPAVINTDVRSVPYMEMWAYFRRLFDGLDLIALERLKSDIDNREPVAKKGVFVDPWQDDTYRDAGEEQTAAIFDGEMQLAVTPSFFTLDLPAPVMLQWTEEVVVRQDMATACMRINPYANFEPLPATLELDPPTDFWVETRTEFLSDVTRSIAGTGQTTTRLATVGQARTRAEFLRQIEITFVIRGFAPGETLAGLVFDGIDVTPSGPLVANGSGVVAGTFDIPEGVPAGTKLVAAIGGGGTPASALWTGEGFIDISTIRRTITTSVPDRGDIGWDPVDLGDRGDPTARGIQADPLAQTFTLIEPRHIAGVDIRVCAVGSASNAILVEIHSVENGIPTAETLAQVSIPMVGVSPGQWIAARFPFPVFLTADREWCVMVKSDDAQHALSIARVGDFDASQQRFVSAQPYSVGVLLSSSNASTWTPHQNEDLTFRLVAARFAPTTRTIDLGPVTVSDMSDLLIRAGVELPSAETSVTFEVEREDGSITRLLPGQTWQIDEFVSEELSLRAILAGTAKLSPTLFPRPLMVAGSIMESGTYVTRAFSMGSAIRMSAFLKARLPSGSALTVEIDAADDDWDAVTLHASTVLDGGWVEREYRVTPYTAATGRLRLTLTGGPAARPRLADMRAVSI